jgi:Na+-driven multidrug efflux pump
MGLLDGIVMRIGLALLLGKVCNMGVEGFWLGSALAGLTYGVVCGPYFLSGKWKKRKPVVKQS